MFRIVYIVLMVALIGGTAWAASNYQPDPRTCGTSGVGLVLITALQRNAAS